MTVPLAAPTAAAVGTGAAAALTARTAVGGADAAHSALAGIARQFYAALASMSEQAGLEAADAFRRLDPDALASSWEAAQLGERLFVRLSSWQQLAATLAQQYVTAAVAAQGLTDAPVATLVPAALAAVASDGRDLETLLARPLVTAADALTQTGDAPAALASGAAALARIVDTQVADAGRAATAAAMATRPAVHGYVRMLTPPSCARCAILAGRVYRWSTGFARHPGCDCVMIPAVEDVVEDLATDPRAYFDSLTAAQQDKTFTRAGAEAIRRGADIAQVVNARRSAAGLSQPGRLTDAEQRVLRSGRARGRLQRVDVFGRQLHVTSEGTTTRGAAGKKLIAVGGATANRTQSERRAARAAGDTRRQPRRARVPRLMPEAIAELAGDDREQYRRLLERFGYLRS